MSYISLKKVHQSGIDIRSPQTRLFTWNTCVYAMGHLRSTFGLLVFLVLIPAHLYAIVSALLLRQSCPIVCDPVDRSLPGSSVHGILQVRILEWVATSSLGNLPNPGIEPMSLMSPVLAGGFFTTSATWEVQTGSKLWKEYGKAIYCHPAYLISMRSTPCEMLGWMTHKLESRFLGEISATSESQMILLQWQKSKRN